LSIWPETWCHTLTELWAVGLPVVGFNTGAVGERLQKTGAGWLAETITAPAMAATIPVIVNRVVQVSRFMRHTY